MKSGKKIADALKPAEKPVSLAPLDFDRAIEGLLKSGSPSNGKKIKPSRKDPR